MTPQLYADAPTQKHLFGFHFLVFLRRMSWWFKIVFLLVKLVSQTPSASTGVRFQNCDMLYCDTKKWAFVCHISTPSHQLRQHSKIGIQTTGLLLARWWIDFIKLTLFIIYRIIFFSFLIFVLLSQLTCNCSG